ncbi:MAG: roadblock/LC7 domain-containing protein [Actinomycetota bacterium]|nr:roadblock/LC7 domain-containing protein [Actinomycetota bacterium]
MDPAQALADLTEVSSQIEGAVLATVDGAVLASSFEADKGEGVARGALELVSAAEQAVADSGRAALTQVEAATATGSVLIITDGTRVLTAVTGPQPTAGLVFYDLKTCLRLAREEEERKTPEAVAPHEGEDA